MMKHPTEFAHEAVSAAKAQLTSAADTIALSLNRLLADNGLIGEVEVTATVTLRTPDGTRAGGADHAEPRMVYAERASGEVLELG